MNNNNLYIHGHTKGSLDVESIHQKIHKISPNKQIEVYQDNYDHYITDSTFDKYGVVYDIVDAQV